MSTPMLQCCHHTYLGEMTLQPYKMVAGERRTITVPVYNSAGNQIDMAGMTARLAISDMINLDSLPFVTKACAVQAQDGSDYSVLKVSLDPEDTLELCGQYIYQITITGDDSGPGVLRGLITIHANYDKGAITI